MDDLWEKRVTLIADYLCSLSHKEVMLLAGQIDRWEKKGKKGRFPIDDLAYRWHAGKTETLRQAPSADGAPQAD